jgi:hypothetical protein
VFYFLKNRDYPLMLIATCEVIYNLKIMVEYLDFDSAIDQMPGALPVMIEHAGSPPWMKAMSCLGMATGGDREAEGWLEMMWPGRTPGNPWGVATAGFLRRVHAETLPWDGRDHLLLGIAPLSRKQDLRCDIGHPRSKSEPGPHSEDVRRDRLVRRRIRPVGLKPQRNAPIN